MTKRNKEDLAPCPLCESDKVYLNSGVQFAVKCENCWHVKLQCFDTSSYIHLLFIRQGIISVKYNIIKEINFA